MWIVGCDTGGTFTDVFAVSDSGESRVAKVPSTPPRFDVGVVEGVGQSVLDVARKLRARGIESVAVCLINAHMNPAHEQRVREILEIELPELQISLSTDILPEPPEFERTATTVANAYCAPVLRRYMDTLEERLAGDGYQSDVVLVMHNGGGTMTTDYAKGVSVKTLNSGPAAGVIAGA